MKDSVPSAPERNKALSDPLPMLDEVLALAPALEANWPAEAAATPPGTLLNRAEPGAAPAGGEPGGEEPGGDEPGGEPGGESPGGNEESFIDSFDLDSVPPEARPHVEALQKDWQGQYTKRRQAEAEEVAGVRREAEESQALIEGLRDPETMPHYLRLLGVDLSNPQTAELLGIPGVGQADEELLDLLDDENDVESRVERIERERAEEVAERQSVQMEQALDDLADQELEGIEKAWGRELDEDEDAFIRHRAEAAPGPDGFPDYESAAKVLKGFLNRRIQEELERRSEPGRGVPGGKPGGKALDVNKDEDRVQLGAAAAERAMASQQ